ncbi:uncharacterized protein LOC135493736 [Lineus longissimus]|uniref:uncharacterized protein LOC135493736 n=1 Tax=Lineus longissimus TaxID=88925 RepID=UPI00315D34BC
MESSLLSTLLLSAFMLGITASLYDPHLYPKKGPFFEGWYIRITDYEKDESLGVLFGKVLPRDPTTSDPPTLVTFLKTDGQKPLKSYDRFLAADDVDVFVGPQNGKVISDPLVKSPAYFSWQAKNCGLLNVTPSGAWFNFTIGTITFNGRIEKPVQWDPEGKGPEGWLHHLPLPLAWFVYSLGSDVMFSWHDSRTGEYYNGKGLAHMEKNWGKSFPTAWFWAEGVRHSDRVSFAMSGGPVGFGPLSVTGHLIGYRNPLKGISLDYRPDNSLMSMDRDACNGALNITFRSVMHKLSVFMKAPVGTFSGCLYGPQANGFQKACSESFKTRAEIVAYERPLIGSYKEMDRQVIEGAALEFGGDFLCKELCDPSYDGSEVD